MGTRGPEISAGTSLVLVLWLAAAGCTRIIKDPGQSGESCATSDDCMTGLECTSNVCLDPDAGDDASFLMH